MAKNDCSMKIEYSEDFGKLKFVCEKDGYKLSDTIPDSVIDKGETEIHKYVRGKMYRHVSQTKIYNIKNKEREERIKNTNTPISLKHKGQELKGRIVDYIGPSDRGLITILLESPEEYAGSHSVYDSYGMGMSGISVFDDDGNLTDWAINRALDSLRRIYNEKRVKEIAKKLNKD